MRSSGTTTGKGREGRLNFPLFGDRLNIEMNKVRTRVSVLLAASVLIAAVLLSSCASIRFAQKEEDVLAVVSLINGGEAETLSGLSQTPFLFDREILMLEKDTKTVWNNLTDADFSLKRPAVGKIEPVSEESYKSFADVMEIEVFFEKYVPETAKIARVETDAGPCLFIFNDKQDGYPMILGMKVW